ncbi:MAG TPA: GWxTD domain-containing protein [Bryobacteraceae bacterium]|jgi:GWxTD domain-containing protein
MRFAFLFITTALWLQAAASGWLASVDPIITPAERKIYLSLQPEARAQFEENFWAEKSITPEEYYRRLQYVDTTFGSGKLASGVNTDPGRVYLSLGPPTRITRIPSSRIFVPLEIWYYDTVPALQLTTELRLIFYQKNSLGFPKLYSPTLDTIRALLLPEAGTIGMFGPNDGITEANIRTTLNVSPAEDEIVSAAVNVASGITNTGNDEVLAQITSPWMMLGKSPQTQVQSRFIAGRPKLDTLETVSTYGGSQVDMRLETNAARELNLAIYEGPVAVYQNRLHLKFRKAEAIHYVHRLDLLPGSYRVLFAVDGQTYAYPLRIESQTPMGEILRVDQSAASSARTPFAFDGRQLEPNAEGRFAVVAAAKPGRVNWVIRKGVQVLWKGASDAQQVATVELPSAGFPAGTYTLEANEGSDSRSAEFIVTEEKSTPPAATLLSFNANLVPALRFASIGHQYLLRGKFEEARQNLQASLDKGLTDQSQIEFARLEAMTGHLDAARDRVRIVLATEPKNFEALSVYAYIEAEFQDYPIAAELYRRALAVQDSAALRLALAKLPARPR